MVQIPQHKMVKVPLYYYQAEHNKYEGGSWLDSHQYMFKTSKQPTELTEKMVAKALGIHMGKDDCLQWWEIKLDNYFKNLAEV